MNVIDCSTNMKEIEIYYKEDIYVFLLVKGSVNIVTIEVVLKDTYPLPLINRKKNIKNKGKQRKTHF